MGAEFPTSAAENRELALSLIRHLRRNLQDTKTRTEWTLRNLDALRSFADHKYDLEHSPPSGSCKKGEFLWDYIAYQQDTGILIAAETEWDHKKDKLKEDFKKLLYVQSQIKVFMFWLWKDKALFEGIVSELTKCMEWSSNYSPGDIFILYCRTWANEDQSSGDLVRLLQIDGEPCRLNAKGKIFEDVLDELKGTNTQTI